jgi:hypothetical protein
MKKERATRPLFSFYPRRGEVLPKALRSEAGRVPLGLPRGEGSEEREWVFLAGKNPCLSGVSPEPIFPLHLFFSVV